MINERISAVIQQIEDELRQDEDIVKKYDCAGVYSISIQGKLAYIGKSRNMLCRLAQHIFYSNNPFFTKSHKYKIFYLAQFMGYDISFDVIYSTSGTEQQQIDDDIGQKEAEMINNYLPPLNYQIPNLDDYRHFTVNRRAKGIKLMEILGEDK